jgi:tryptophan synthase alpha subunit
MADGAVVGSALVDAIAEAVSQSRDPAALVLDTAAALAKAVQSARAGGS